VSLTVTRLLVPLKDSALPYFPAVTQVAPRSSRRVRDPTRRPPPSRRLLETVRRDQAAGSGIRHRHGDRGRRRLIAGRVASPGCQRMRAVGCGRRVPADRVRRGRVFGAKSDAVEQELHSATPTPVRCRRRDRHRARDGAAPRRGAVTDTVGAVVSVFCTVTATVAGRRLTAGRVASPGCQRMRAVGCGRRVSS